MSGHFFISYSRADSRYAWALADKLSGEGIDAFIDRDIGKGHRFTTTLRTKITTCALFVLVMSPNAKRSRMVEEEALLAEASGRRIVPLLLEGESYFPYAGLQYIDVRDGSLPSAESLLGQSRETPGRTTVSEVEPPRPWTGKADEGPVFFLSYARRPPGRAPAATAPVVQLAADLERHLANLLPVAADRRIGFMDSDLVGGEAWERRLLGALGTCEVFVALLSPGYTVSRWCAMEWHAFARRKVRQRRANGPADSTAIIPVLWVPASGRVPDQIRGIQTFHPGGQDGYVRDGLYGLLRTDRDAYEATVWRLARTIATTSETLTAEPLVLSDTSGLRDSFD